VLLIAVTYTVINLLVDLAYLVIDPRIRYTG
jgi:ABC-type dipeptide/oligopeptide/nickel transport system permease component